MHQKTKLNDLRPVMISFYFLTKYFLHLYWFFFADWYVALKDPKPQFYIISLPHIYFPPSSFSDEARSNNNTNNNYNNNNNISTSNNNNNTLNNKNIVEKVFQDETQTSSYVCPWQHPSTLGDISTEPESGFHDAHMSADFSNDTIGDDFFQQYGALDKQNASPAPQAQITVGIWLFHIDSFMQIVFYGFLFFCTKVWKTLLWIK